ncbi:hypothetical protein GS493_04795 [Rhodococcus hoagii]|nr:hypothetical protein [Prescottella equi]
MHSTYLHSLYGENQLAKGRFTIAGRDDLAAGRRQRRLHRGRALDDHIVPWQSS